MAVGFGRLAGAGAGAGPAVASLCHAGIALAGAGVGMGQGSPEMHHAGVVLAEQLELVWVRDPWYTEVALETWLEYLDLSLFHTITMEGECKKWCSQIPQPWRGFRAVSHPFGRYFQISKYTSFTCDLAAL